MPHLSNRRDACNQELSRVDCPDRLSAVAAPAEQLLALPCDRWPVMKKQGCVLIALYFLLLCTPKLAGEPTGRMGLDQRIDTLISEAYEGEFAERASDAEFLRRCFLDLAGRTPTVEEVTSFLADSNRDKREALIDNLLESEDFNQFFATVLDLMLMERRGGRRIPQEEWRTFLHDAVANQRSFAEIAQQILRADGSGETRGAAKFLIEREVEPNALTRDVARIFLGRDLQCAQCHDHPNISDYLQSEYYGIYAFVDRSYLFEDAADNNKSYVGEKAEGTTEFKSVFLPEDGTSTTAPQLLGGLFLEAEPRWEGESAYVLAPTKQTAGIPKFSRRRQLARLVTHPANPYFARNVANRLWAHMTGQGLVDPVDFHHSDNPPSHPALLKLLADELVAMDFDIREFLRQIARSDTYQRSIDLPLIEGLPPELLARRKHQLESLIAERQAELAQEQSRQDVFQDQLKRRRTVLNATDEAISEAANQLQELVKTQQSADKTIKALQTKLAQQEQQLQVLKRAAEAARAVAKAFPDEKGFQATTNQYRERTAGWEQKIQNTNQSLTEQQGTLTNNAQQQASLKKQLAALRADRIVQADMVAEARGALRVFAAPKRDLRASLREAEQRLARLQTQLEFQRLRDREVVLGKQVENLKAALAQEESLEPFEGALADAENQLAESQLELDACRQRAVTVEQTVTESTRALESIADAIRDAKSAADQLEDPTLRDVVQSLEQQQTVLKNHVLQRQRQVTERQRELERALATHASKKEKRNALADDLKRRRTAHEEKERQWRKARDEHQSAVVDAKLAADVCRDALQGSFAVRALKPLSPEQLAGSVIAGLGLRTRFAQEAEAEWNKKQEGKEVESIDPQQKQAAIRALEKQRIQQVENAFVSLFAAPAGAPQDVFSSTADQSLFFSNDGRMQYWLRPTTGSTIQRLETLTNGDELASQLYLCILCRPATETERRDVAEYLVKRKDDRRKAIQELAWGLLSSLEFRFNH